MSSPTPESDELKCGICRSTRAAHVSLNHEFNLDGVLIPKRKTAPERAARHVVPADSVLLRLINTLAAKGILNAEDLSQIFPPAVDPHVNPH